VRLTSGLFVDDLPIASNEGNVFGGGGREGEGRMNVDERRALFIPILNSGKWVTSRGAYICFGAWCLSEILFFGFPCKTK